MLTTARAPRRAAELLGGSVYWIVGHRLIARQPIGLIVPSTQPPGVLIHLGAEVIAVEPRPWRAHQGWRYLRPEEAPPDLEGDPEEAALLAELRALALLD